MHGRMIPQDNDDNDFNGRRPTAALSTDGFFKPTPKTLRGSITSSVGRQVNNLSIFQLCIITCFIAAYSVNAFPVVYAANEKHFIRNINTSLSFDPVSLITLFFDSAEKQLMERSGDLNLLSCLGLFVNPTTAWGEYGTLYPGEGLQYYVPTKLLTSTVEVAQVNNFLLKLARSRRNCGIVVKLENSSTLPSVTSWEWKLRPLLPIVLVIFVGLGRDFWALGAIACLFVGQTVVIFKSMYDGRKQEKEKEKGGQVEHETPGADPKATLPQTPQTEDRDAKLAPSGSHTSQDEQSTVLLLANNVTVIIKSHGQLFVEAAAAIHCKKVEKPAALEVLTILIFMAGVLMVGFAGINFKIAYLVGHAMQAVLIALGNASRINARNVNGVTWRVLDGEKTLRRRRDTYVWATKETGTANTGWLTKFSLAPDDLVSEITTQLQNED